jgi:hypothetical protein
VPDGRIEVEGIRELRNKMRKMGVEGSNKALRTAHKNVAKLVEGRSRGRGTAQQVKAAKAILGKGETAESIIKIRNLASVPFGIGAFMGAKQYKQFPEWVGNDWNLEAGTGPYVIAEVIASGRTDIIEAFVEEMRSAAEALGLDWD